MTKYHRYNPDDSVMVILLGRELCVDVAWLLPDSLMPRDQDNPVWSRDSDTQARNRVE